MLDFFPFEMKHCYRLASEQEYYEEQLRRNLYIPNYEGEVCSWGFNLVYHKRFTWDQLFFNRNFPAPDVSGCFVKHSKRLYFVVTLYWRPFHKFLFSICLFVSLLLFAIGMKNQDQEMQSASFMFFSILISFWLIAFLFFALRILNAIKSSLSYPERCSYQEIKRQEKEAQSS